MIRYDWIVLREYKLSLIFNVMLALRGPMKEQPRHILQIVKEFEDTASFLINPLGLVTNSEKHTDSDLFTYLSLASLRSYITYKQTGSRSLPTYYAEQMFNIDKLKLNTSLRMTNKDIIFIYEEI